MMKLTRQYQKKRHAKQCKSGANAQPWPTLGITGIRPARTCTIFFRDWLGEYERDGNPMRSISSALLTACIVLCATVLTATSRWGQEKKSSPELTVAAAADLSSALQEIADGYEKKTGVHLKLSFGASGALTQQIQNGA